MRRAYLDNNSTTPVDPQVLEAMLPYLQSEFGNPASSTHSFGWAAEAAVDSARGKVAKLLHAKNSEITFTSGATESNNLVLQGFVAQLKKQNPNLIPHIITSDVEHSCVRECLKYLHDLGAISLTILKSNEYGIITAEVLQQALRPETRLVSFIWGNNEIGSLNPIRELVAITQPLGIAFHTDATQATGKIPTSMQDVMVDFLSFSSHKIYGPKGVGALYTRSSSSVAKLSPLLFGGGQERGLRSGTLNVPAIVGFGVACELALKQQDSEYKKLTSQRNSLFTALKSAIPEMRLNGHPEDRLPGHLSLTFPGQRLDALLPRMQQLALSSTSACASGANAGSPVLSALGLSLEDQLSTLRVGIGRFTTEADLEFATNTLLSHLKSQKFQELS